ncbi:MAG: RNA methyltransferase [Oscillospiraceae bacterium]|nr:RNA methyltransferase [Oscillospiraceae bacterium]
MEIITSGDNSRIKQYRRLFAEKKFRLREGLFVTEGARLTADAAREGAGLEYVLVSSSGAEHFPDEVQMISDSCKVYMISDRLADMLSGTRTTQGIFGVCRIPEIRNAAQCGITHGMRIVVLDDVQDPGNMGTILRTADACGVDRVVLCGCCDEYSPKAVRSAMGSVLRVKPVHDTFENTVSVLKENGIKVWAAVINGGTDLLKAHLGSGAGVIIGNEGSGISPQHAQMADEGLTITMHGTIESLNAAMAAGIIMWELTK